MLYSLDVGPFKQKTKKQGFQHIDPYAFEPKCMNASRILNILSIKPQTTFSWENG